MARRAVRFTSIAALQKHVKSGARCTARHLVLSTVVDSEGLSRAEIAKVTGLGVNVVCGRVSELIAEDILTDSNSFKECTVSGNYVHKVQFNQAIVASGGTAASDWSF